MRVLLPKRYLKGIIAFLLFLIGTAALVGATLPASYQQQLGLSASGSIFADLFNLQPTNPFVVNYAPPAPMPGNPSADIDQCANDPAPSLPTDGCNSSATQWVNGNLGASKSVYREGDSIPYRLRFDNLALSSHTVTIEWDTTKSGKHAIDYIDTYNQSVGNANPCLGVTGCGAPFTFPIPADPQVTGAGVTPIAGNFTLYGGTITGVSAYSYPTGAGFTGDKSARITITFSANQANPTLAWGGHIATRANWGNLNSAVAISGSPYHTRLIDLDGSGGNQDRSLSAAAVIFPSSITIIKDTRPEGPQDFSYTTSNNLNPPSFILDDDADATRSNTQAYLNLMIPTGDTFTISETTVTNWALTFNNPPCVLTSSNGGSSSSSGNTVTITLKEGENYTCTFINTEDINATHGRIIVDKVTVPGGDPTLFSFTSDFSGNFQLADGSTPLDSGLIVPGTYSVSETSNSAYTTTSSCSDGSSPGSISLQAGETVTCTFTNTLNQPALTIDKVATESGFSAVGQVIHYTITATNTGNVTLTSVTVTDPNASGLSCTPANGSSLAPGASMTCTASHTIVQADLDAGSFYNQACVDDGAGGAASVCDDVTTPGTKNPALSITKDATESSYNAVGQVIHYTIVATNTGNVTLASVTVTDTEAVLGTCTPANGSSLAPGASMTCAATHTVTQADIDAGTYNNTACVDDGAGGAAQVCDDADVPAVKSPALTIDKVATESGFSAVGDVIHYTITATNTGNVTLSNVNVTDSQVSNLSCTPTTPVASLAPGASITCTASHTIVQADIDAGSFYNQACVDDGAGGAASVCDDVTTPGNKNPHLAILKTSPTTGYNAVGQVISYSIVATNDGNTTLTNVTVTDPNASGLSCTPTNGSNTLAPGASMTCSASHTVTQADIDAGHYYNQACVNAATASQACDDEDTPGLRSPHLAIVKTVTETQYAAVGDVIHYSITATNDGNTTLGAVTITDAAATLGTCTPANGSALAPGGTIVCTATHTVTQADITAGHYLNTACVDDGAGGAAQVCDDVDIPAAPPVNVSGSYPTQTTCQDFIGNLVQPQEDGQYSVKGNKISQANPGVIFYYSRWTPANGTAYIDQAVVAPPNFTRTLVVQSVGLFRASNCSAAPGTVTSPFTVTVPNVLSDPNGIRLTGLTVGLEYVVAVKYSVSSITGATAPSGGAAIVWQFETRDNLFNVVASDANGFTLTKK